MGTSAAIDVAALRADFPILSRRVNGAPLVYLDSAATSQKPVAVLDAMDAYYRETNANVHRGVYTLAADATDRFEAGRDSVARLVNAPRDCTVFAKNASEAINLVAWAWGVRELTAGDEILVTEMEHHSNIVPWQIVAEITGATVRFVPVTPEGELDMGALQDMLSERTRMVAVVHASNVLGTINPVAEIAHLAHEQGALVLVDGSQSAPHMPVDFAALGCDFLAFTGHKMLGPTGVGVLWGRAELLDAMPPWQGGGDMILSVAFEKTLYREIPHKFEAGTPDIAGVVGLGAALDWLGAHDHAAVAAHERELLERATAGLAGVPGLRLVGEPRERTGVVSFVLDDVHPHDVGTILDHEGIAVRTGHHCAQPLMERFGVPATVRASFALYNTREDVDALLAGLARVREVFA